MVLLPMPMPLAAFALASEEAGEAKIARDDGGNGGLSR
jgi:hypothetical protein